MIHLPNLQVVSVYDNSICNPPDSVKTWLDSVDAYHYYKKLNPTWPIERWHETQKYCGIASNITPERQSFAQSICRNAAISQSGMTLTLSQPSKVTVFTARGTVISSMDVPGAGKVRIDGAFPKGIYLVKIDGAGKQEMKRVMYVGR